MNVALLPQTLDDWLRRIEALHPSEIELGLSRLRQVARALPLEPLTAKVITVAGTNGKGSTLALMRALAERRGQKVALYSSPHLHRFNERIRLPDGLASDSQLCQAFTAVEQARGRVSLTYFEFTTLAALWLFARSDADLVLLEVGLGGRLDAVNIVDPDVAVVTSVGLDHQDWLGDDRETIAAEKCAIGRPGRALIYGENDWPDNLLALVADRDARGVLAGRDFAIRDGQLRLLDGQLLTLPETVVLGADNLATACQALALAGVHCDESDLRAVAALGLAGRCQQLSVDGKTLWLDVGHNQEAVARFLQQLPGLAAGAKRHLVFAMMKDKPVATVMALFASAPADWYLAELDQPRASRAAALQQHCPEGHHSHCFASPAMALQAALSAASKQDQVLVFGSFFTVAAAAEYLQARYPEEAE